MVLHRPIETTGLKSQKKPFFGTPSHDGPPDADPQRLKPLWFCETYGTTEVVP